MMPPSPESQENTIRAKRILGYKVTLLCAYRGVMIGRVDEEVFRSGQFIDRLRKEGTGTIAGRDCADLARKLGVDLHFLKSPNPCSYEDLVAACEDKECRMNPSARGSNVKMKQQNLEELNELGFTDFDELIGYQA